MPDDRFSEDEIRRVFEQAAAAQSKTRQDAHAAGLTLDEMAEAGEASGIPRELIEAAARSVRRGPPESRRTALGPLPTGVFHSVPLAEPPSDALWARLVADARRTFDARGRAESLGPDYEWRNGNLRVTLEPAGDGSRLTLRSDRRRNTAGLLAAAGTEIIVGVMMLMVGVANDPTLIWTSGLFLCVAAALLASVWVRQRRWADARERQMTALAERAASEASAAPVPSPAGTGRTAEPRLDPGVLDEALGETLDDVPDSASARRARA